MFIPRVSKQFNMAFIKHKVCLGGGYLSFVRKDVLSRGGRKGRNMRRYGCKM